MSNRDIAHHFFGSTPTLRRPPPPLFHPSSLTTPSCRFTTLLTFFTSTDSSTGTPLPFTARPAPFTRPSTPAHPSHAHPHHQRRAARPPRCAAGAFAGV